jgi:hypothetical protein
LVKRRVVFLDHVMGLPGPIPCVNRGQVLEIPDEMFAMLTKRQYEAAVGARSEAVWMEEYEGETVECVKCDRLFAPDYLAEHRQFYHGESLYEAVSARVNAGEPKGTGGFVCPYCSRRFPTRHGLGVHAGKVHKKERDRPPVARENSERGIG